MTLEDDREILEEKKREIYKEQIQPIEDAIQEINKRINESKISVNIEGIDIEAIKSKYKEVEIIEKLVK
jgi:hypothetical protein